MSKKFNWLFILGLGYFLTRLWGLVSFPLFTDEVYYLRLIKESGNDLFWVSFKDGKEPLFFWILTVFIKYFPDPIYIGRLFSVVSGFGTLIFVYYLGREIFSEKAGRIAAIFYLLSPFALIYNRLSILDGWLTFLITGFIYFLVKTSKERVFSWPVIAGIFYGLALITKTISQLYLVLIPIVYFVFGQTRRHIMIIALAALIYLPLVLAPGFTAISQKNLTFTYPIDYAFGHLSEIFIPNLKMSLKDWLLSYFGLLPFLAIFTAGILGGITKNLKVIGLVAIFLVPLLAESLVAKIFFPRYLLFLIIPCVLLVGYLLAKIKNAATFKLCLMIFLFQPAFLFFQILVTPESANLPVVEQWQFFTGWPSVVKAEKSIQDIKKLSRTRKVIVATQNYGVGEFIRYEFYGNPNVVIKIISSDSTRIEADYFALNE